MTFSDCFGTSTFVQKDWVRNTTVIVLIDSWNAVAQQGTDYAIFDTCGLDYKPFHRLDRNHLLPPLLPLHLEFHSHAHLCPLLAAIAFCFFSVISHLQTGVSRGSNGTKLTSKDLIPWIPNEPLRVAILLLLPLVFHDLHLQVLLHILLRVFD